MDAALPLLIEGATAARDRLAMLARDSAGALAQARATLERLAQFRRDYLTRSPTASGRAVTTQALEDYQRFLSRLDDAIRLQAFECERRVEREAVARAQLAEGQRRLTAFETLRTRRTAVRQLKQTRRDQRDADEFAARSARAASTERSS